MLASLTEEELRELHGLAVNFHAGQAMNLLETFDAVMPKLAKLLALARAARKLEALRHEWALRLASNTTAHEQYLECMEDAVDRLDSILEALTAAAEPTAGEDR